MAGVKAFNLAKHEGCFCNAHIDAGYVFGVFRSRYYYKTTVNGLTVKTAGEDKIPYYLTDFRPLYYARRYDGKYCAVYNVRVWDEVRKKWINTDTGANRKLYKLGEFLQLEILKHGLYGKWLPVLDEKPILRQTRPDFGKGNQVYGYMCKTPDLTMTQYDLIGDAYAENRRIK